MISLPDIGLEVLEVAMMNRGTARGVDWIAIRCTAMRRWVILRLMLQIRVADVRKLMWASEGRLGRKK